MGYVGPRQRLSLAPSPSAPFDKTANITFSLNADDENVSAALSRAGQGCGGHCPSPTLTLAPQPSTNLLELCYKDRIQQFDDEEEDSRESDGEDGAWDGCQRTSEGLGQPLAVR